MLTALITLPIIGLGLQFYGVKHCQRTLDRLASRFAKKPFPLPASYARAQSSARMVNIAARYGPYRAKCLARSLCTQFLLSCSGINSELRIGVSKPDGQFAAHAWVVCQGKIINDRADVDEQYQSFGNATKTARS